MGVAEQSYAFSTVGGNLSLNFTNTVNYSLDGRAAVSEEHFNDYGDLVEWGRQLEVLSEEGAQRLLVVSYAHPAEAQAVLERALVLRESLFRLFSAIEAGKLPGESELDVYNQELSRSMAQLRLTPGAEGLVWDWNPDPVALDRMLWPVVRAAADLLVSSERIKIRMCEGATCSWLFLDLSRNHSRHWCDMRDCGNRAKAKRHYHRKRSGDEC